MKTGVAKRQKRIARWNKARIKQVAEVTLDDSDGSCESARRVFIFKKSAAKSSSALNGSKM
jgi:hypothetical protein